MRGKIGLAIVLLTAVAWLASESQSFAGRRHCRGGRCGGWSSCGTACAPVSTCGPSGCGVAPEAAPEAAAPAAPSPSDSAPPAPEAPSADASSSEEAPQVAQATTVSQPVRYYNASRRARRGWFRRR